jgi:endonuclease III
MQVRTILSQNTTDTNSVRAFKSLKERFPTWEAVRTAPEGEREVYGHLLAAQQADSWFNFKV